MATREAALGAVEADLVTFFDKAPFAEGVRRLGAYRGVTTMGALALQAEVCDWRRFGRAASFMGFVGLVPSEDSSGQREHRGHITKSGNAHLRAQLVESAWSYQHRPYVGAEIAKRQVGLPPEVVARLVGGAVALMRALPSPGRAQEHQKRRRCCHRQRAGRVLVGGDDSLR